MINPALRIDLSSYLDKQLLNDKNRGCLHSMVDNLQVHNLRRVIKNECKSQTEFAQILQVPDSMVTNWLKGKHEISIKNAKKICERFPGYDLEFILGNSPYPNKQSESNHQQFKEHHIHECIEDIAKHRGFNVYAFSTFDAKAINEDEWREQWPDLNTDKFIYYERLENGDGKTLTITDEQWNAFVDEVCSYVEMRLNLLIERGAW